MIPNSADSMVPNAPPSSGGGMAIGGAVTGAVAGSALFVDGSGNLADDGDNFFYDASLKMLEIGKDDGTGGFVFVQTIGHPSILLSSQGSNYGQIYNTGSAAPWALGFGANQTPICT